MTIKSAAARFGAVITAAFVTATVLPMAAHAVIITQGALSVDIRADNGAIDAISFGEDFFNPGVPVSDWGLRVGIAFDIAETDGGAVGVFGSTSAPVGGVITATGSHVIGYQRDYNILAGLDVLRTVTTLSNPTGSLLSVVLFETYDPDQGPGSATNNDVLPINGVLGAQAANGPVAILGSTDPSAILGFHPFPLGGLGISNNTELTNFLASSAAVRDPNGVLSDIGYGIAFQTRLAAGTSVSFTTFHAFGSNRSEAQAAFASAVGVPEPATLALFGLGLAGLGFARRRKAA